MICEVFDSRLHHANFGYRPRRHRSQAASYCQQIIRSGRTLWLKADIKDCYGSIRRRRLNGLIKKLIWFDKQLAELLMKFVAAERRPRGIIQGGSLSPFLSNLYLDSLDCNLASRGYLFARYGDDFIVGLHAETDATEAMAFLKSECKKIQIELNGKSKIVDLSKEHKLNFCGFQISANDIAVSLQAVKRMQEKSNRLIDEYFNSGAAEAVAKWESDAGPIELLLLHKKAVRRKLERRRNAILKRFDCVTVSGGRLLPSYSVYLENWCNSMR